MFEHFDEAARTCVVLAQEEAGRLGHEELGTVHLLLGVAGVDPGLIGVAIEPLRAAVVALTGSRPARTGDPMPISAEAKAAFEGANAQALSRGHTTIDAAHLLLALLDAGGGVPRALREAGAPPGAVRERAAAGAGANAGSPPHATPATAVGGTIADIGRPHLDAYLLELILGADGPVARLLREHGIDEIRLREAFGPANPSGERG